MGLLTNESIGVFQADASRASVVQLSSGPMNAVTPISLICVIALETEAEIETGKVRFQKLNDEGRVI